MQRIAEISQALQDRMKKDKIGVDARAGRVVAGARRAPEESPRSGGQRAG